MDSEAQKAVNKTIIALSEYIQETIKSNLADRRKDLPALVNALAELSGH